MCCIVFILFPVLISNYNSFNRPEYPQIGGDFGVHGRNVGNASVGGRRFDTRIAICPKAQYIGCRGRTPFGTVKFARGTDRQEHRA